MPDYIPKQDEAAFVSSTWPSGRVEPGALTWQGIQADGSDRIFVRVIHGRQSAIMVKGTDPAENRSYQLIGSHLWSLNQLGPQFFGHDPKTGLFLIEDLGDTQLVDFVQPLTESEKVAAYKSVIDLMVRLHRDGTPGFDTGWCFQTPEYDKEFILSRETGYFLKEFVAEYANLNYNKAGAAVECEALADAALAGAELVLMHRDFQSRNIMVTDGNMRLVDFQGARLGPPGYDLASLLYDPYVNLRKDQRRELLDYYLTARPDMGLKSKQAFESNYPYLAVCRMLQALGAFGFLSRKKKKLHFKEHIPAALKNVRDLLDDKKMDQFKNIKEIIGKARVKLEVAK